MRLALRIVAWMAALWLALAASTVPLWPLGDAMPSFEHDDEHPNRLFVSEIQAAVFELARHCPLPPAKRVILIGGSGGRAFKPALLRPYLPGIEVLGLSMDYSNFTQIRRVVDDVAACIGPEGMRQARFVVIPTYMSFVDDRRRFTGGPTVWDAEKLRSLLYRGEPGALSPVVPGVWLPLAVELWRPVFLARALVHGTGQRAESRAARLAARLSAKPPPGPPDRDREFRWREHLLPEPAPGEEFAPEQKQVLAQLADRIRDAGAELVIAEQPTQAWLRERSRAYQAAHAELERFSTERGLRFIDLSRSAAEGEFHDALHATPEGFEAWSARLGAALAAP